MITNSNNSYLSIKLIISISIFLLATQSYADVSVNEDKEIFDIANKGGFSIYGNWCGPNHPKDINNADNPIDLLDSQCKTHDLCYVDKGEYDCSCDRAMVLDIDKNQLNKFYNPKQYLLAQNIKLHFAISPCNGEVENNKVLPTRILTNIYNKTKDRALNLIDRFTW